MSKHTPGPWKWYVNGDIKSADGKKIAYTHLEPCNANHNAKLIAAAPDLLQFAQAIEDIMLSTGHNLCSTATYGERTAFIDRIICAWNHGGILAITKAKGES